MNGMSDPLESAFVQHVSAVLSRSGQAVRSLKVAGRNARVGSKIVTLDGGVAGQFVLKRIPMAVGNWWRDLTGSSDVESVLWNAGITKELPHPLRSVHLDVSAMESLGEWWVVMRQVEIGSPDDPRFIQTLIDGMAALHARHWQSESIRRLPLCRLEGVLAFNALPLIALSATQDIPSWVPEVQAVPEFETQAHWFDLLTAPQHSFYVKLWENRSAWLPRLKSHPGTLTHGDFHRGNFLIQKDGTVAVVDWSLAGIAPGCLDAVYFEFMTLWCDARREEMIPALAAERRRLYDEALGRLLKPVSVESPWELAWLAAFMQLASRAGSLQFLSSDPFERDEIMRFLQNRVFREAMRITAKL